MLHPRSAIQYIDGMALVMARNTVLMSNTIINIHEYSETKHNSTCGLATHTRSILWSNEKVIKLTQITDRLLTNSEAAVY